MPYPIASLALSDTLNERRLPLPDKTLAEKLRVKPGYRVVVLNQPADFDFGPWPTDVVVSSEPGTGADAVILFIRSSAELATWHERATGAVTYDALVWFLYPKGTTRPKPDINRDSLWREMETHGFTGVAMVSVDDTWSAFRLRPSEAVSKAR